MTLSTVASWFTRYRGRMSGIVKVEKGVGQFSVPLIAKALIATLDWRKTYLIIGGIVLVLLTALTQLMKRDPEKMGLQPDGGRHSANDFALAKADQGLSLRQRCATCLFSASISLNSPLSFVCSPSWSTSFPMPWIRGSVPPWPHPSSRPSEEPVSCHRRILRHAFSLTALRRRAVCRNDGRHPRAPSDRVSIRCHGRIPVGLHGTDRLRRGGIDPGRPSSVTTNQAWRQHGACLIGAGQLYNGTPWQGIFRIIFL